MLAIDVRVPAFEAVPAEIDPVLHALEAGFALRMVGAPSHDRILFPSIEG
jgi:hypothetical protein